MFEIFCLIALVLGIVALCKISGLKERVRELEETLQELIKSEAAAARLNAGLASPDATQANAAAAAAATAGPGREGEIPPLDAPAAPDREQAGQIETGTPAMPSVPRQPAAAGEAAADPSPQGIFRRRLGLLSPSGTARDAAPVSAAVASAAQREGLSSGPTPPDARDAQRSEARAATWKRIEQQVVENWLGIIGAVVMVTGVAFLGIYTALRMGAFYRFLLISGFAALLAAAFLALRRLEKWERFSYWLGSSSAAIFLFGCLGSGHIPGLQWVHSPHAALGLVFAGIAVNMLFAYFTASQNFTSIHTILSLIALAIAPPGEITMALAALVSLFGIAFSYRHRWDVHLLVVIGAFFCFNAYWSFEFHPASNPEMGKMVGRICTIAVAVAAGLIHYRRDYSSPQPERLPLAAHLLNWLFLGAGLLLYALSPLWSTIGLFTGAVVAFATARQGRAVGVRWVYVTDTLVSLFLAYLGVMSLYRLHVDTALIFFFAFATAILFLAAMVLEGEEKLRQVGIHLVHASGMALLAFGLFDRLTPTARPTLNILLSLGGAAVAGLAFYAFLHRSFGRDIDAINLFSAYEKEPVPFSLLGMLVCGFVAVLALHLFRRPGWVDAWGWLLLIFLAAIILVRHWLRGSPSLGAGALVVTGIGQFLTYLNGSQWLPSIAFTGTQTAIQSLPLFAIPVLQYRFSRNLPAAEPIRDRCVYLFGVHAMATSYFLLTPVAQVIPPAGWFAAAAAAFEACRRWSASDDDGLARAGHLLGRLALLFIVATTFREILVQLQLAPHWGGIPERSFMAALFMALIPLSLAMTRGETWSRAIGLLALVPLFFATVVLWVVLIQSPSVSMAQKGIRLIPLFAIPLLLVRYAGTYDREHYLRRFFVYLFGANSLAAPYLLLNTTSPLLPGILWLCLSLLYLEAAQLLAARPGLDRGDLSRDLLGIALCAVAAFVVRHVFVHLQFEDYLGFVRIRLLIEGFAVAVFAYWLFQRPMEKPYRLWMLLQPLFLELMIAFVTLSIAMEVSHVYYPLFWIGMAVSLLAIGLKAGPPYSRLKLYALFFAWVTAVQVAVSTSTLVVPSTEWQKQPLLIGSVVILVQFAFLFALSRKPYLEGTEFPDALRGLGRLVDLIEHRKTLCVFYPFFISTALFLFWCFDRSVLTLLWVLEAFGIFLLGLIMIENHFRILSMGALAACVLRLVFIDMAQSGTLVRGLVFLGVGVIMLSMNAIYNKYKDRMVETGA